VATNKGHILLDGKPYLLRSNGYSVAESPASQPNTASDPSLQSGDHWARWEQSDWLGMGADDWLGDGPFADGWGLNLSTPGQIDVADRLALSLTEASNTAGYITLVDGTTRLWFLGQTNATAYSTTNGTSWTTTADRPAAGEFTRSKGYLKGTMYLTTHTGKLYSLAGTTFTNIASNPQTTVAYILGAHRGKLWIGYANRLYYYDGAAWSAEQFTALVDGTPAMGAVGNTSLFFVTLGPNANAYQTDGNQLVHLGSFPSDFLPRACVFLETLYIFGDETDQTNKRGRVWRLEEGGFVPIFELGDATQDYGIRSAEIDQAKILFGANRYTGIGVFDPALDIVEQPVMGFYIGSTISTVAGTVNGLAQFNGELYCGIQGSGIYATTTPGLFRYLSSKFDNNRKNVNKLWGFGELRTSELLAGQSVTLNTTRDLGTNLDDWGSAFNLVGADDALLPAPVTDVDGALPEGYRHPFMQMELTGDANGSALTIFDTSLAFVETPDNPKTIWTLVLAIEGSKEEPQIMLDESENPRTAKQMIADLKKLWNKQVAFEDMDGKSYRVMVKRPKGTADDIFKDVESGEVEDFTIYYGLILVEM